MEEISFYLSFRNFSTLKYPEPLCYAEYGNNRDCPIIYLKPKRKDSVETTEPTEEKGQSLPNQKDCHCFCV